MLPLLVALLYSCALFAFAYWTDQARSEPYLHKWRPAAYALALAVYCTSWTYYGAVGSAVADGWSYLPIYLGPILLFVFGRSFLRKMIEAFKADGASSLSDFIGGRFDSSRGVALLVPLFCCGCR